VEADAVGHQANDRGAGRHADVAEADDPGQARAGAEGVGAAARREYLGDDDRQAGPEAGEARDRDGRDPGCQRQPQASGRDYAADPDDGDDAKAVDEPVADPTAEGHRDRERGETERGQAGARAQVVLEVDRGPVAGRALPHQAAHAEHGERKDEAAHPLSRVMRAFRDVGA